MALINCTILLVNCHVNIWDVLHKVRHERNILHRRKWRKAIWIGRILRRNCLLKQDIEEKQKGREDEEEDAATGWL